MIKQSIKNFLYSAYCPNFLSWIYFKRKDEKMRSQLHEVLSKKGELIQMVEGHVREHWVERINKVINADDNKFIPRCRDAGKIIDGFLIMHNGIKIDPLSYYSFPMLKMLIDNKGVHEPEEESAFQKVLKQLNPGRDLNMLELGAYWSFYSMWLLSVFPKARCIMVEPDKKNLFCGMRNFAINNFKGKFIHAGIGKVKRRRQNITSVDDLCRENKIDFLDILHSDIQGFEYEMLEGAKRMLLEQRIGYVFISTHSNDLHVKCQKALTNYGFKEVRSVDLNESSSWDGILVMRAAHYLKFD